MSVKFLYLLVSILSLTALSAFAGDREVFLRCKDVDGKFPGVTLFRDGSTPLLEYSFQEKSWLTRLTALSGLELMGNEGSWLVFFEHFPHNNRYLLSLIETEPFETIAAVTLTCDRN